MLRTESYKKGIVHSSIFNVIAKIAAFVQQWLIGYYFGIGSGTDVFFFTYNIILFVSFFFLNFTTSVLIPEGMKIRNTESDAISKQFFNFYILGYAIIGLIFSVIANIDTQWLMRVASSFPQEVIVDNVSLVRWCVPIIFLNLIVSIMSEILVSYKYFTVPNIVTFTNYIIGIAFIIIFHDSMKLQSVAMGLILGYIVNLLVVVIMMKRELKWDFLVFRNSRFKQISGSALYSQCGYIVYLAALYVPQNIFSQMSSGVLTAVNFADKILTIPSIFLVGQITNVMAIKINNLVSVGRLQELSILAEKLIIVTTVGLLIVSVAISVLSDWIVTLLFSWGNYDMKAMSVTSRILSTMIFYLPFSFTYGILMKFYNAFKKQNIFFYIQAFTQAITVVLYLYFIPNIGIYIYPMCRILPYLLATISTIFLLKSFYGSLRIRYTILVLLGIAAIVLYVLIKDFVYN